MKLKNIYKLRMRRDYRVYMATYTLKLFCSSIDKIENSNI